jgi:lipopolysaccharide/colanic/teichoic acid biosynthesis glycosyltransferase
MGVTATLIVTLLGSAGAILVAAELQAWLPSLLQYLLTRAVKKLSPERQERYREEWAAHIEELPGEVSRVVFALQLPITSETIEREARLGPLDSISRWSWKAKDLIDLAATALALLELSPLLLIIALLIKLDSRGPVFFRQRRQGVGNRLFDVYKFRTMHLDVGDPLDAPLTRRGDPRVTRVGAFLRSTSLDELPQLLNVLRGEMSLVGPRPHSPHLLVAGREHAERLAEYELRHRVKPGITGLAQVNGYRGAINTPGELKSRIDCDLYYIDHWSLWLDVKILFRTMVVCFSGRDAF